MVRLLKIGWILAALAAVLCYPLYGLLSLTSKEVVFVTPFEEKQVRINRGMFKLDPPKPDSPDWRKKVIGIYGLPNDNPDVVVFVPESRITRPAEDPSISFMLVDKDKGENPWQLKSFLFAAKWGTIAAFAAAVVLHILWHLLHKRTRPPQPA